MLILIQVDAILRDHTQEFSLDIQHDTILNSIISLRVFHIKAITSSVLESLKKVFAELPEPKVFLFVCVFFTHTNISQCTLKSKFTRSFVLYVQIWTVSD